ncbi:MAG: VOC family protein [Planctomycetes bacterium]|nr:VOC family protein [Planctomycetota bacterium]
MTRCVGRAGTRDSAILEVCGFNDWLIALLEEYGCREIVLIHPGKRSKRKTDRRDAGTLSELLWLNRGRLRQGEKPQGLRRVVIPSAEDGHKAVEQLKELGVPLLAGPQERPDGVVQLFVRDPDGHVVELCSPPAN